MSRPLIAGCKPDGFIAKSHSLLQFLHAVPRNSDSAVLHIDGLLECWTTYSWHNACGLVTLLVSGQGLPHKAVWGLQAERSQRRNTQVCEKSTAHGLLAYRLCIGKGCLLGSRDCAGSATREPQVSAAR